MLGDALTEFFIKKDTYRKNGEEMNDFESRFRTVVRKMDKALTAVRAEVKMPSEVYGWFLLNVLMVLEPSDAANVRGRAASYKLEDVVSSLTTMWSGSSLALRDAEARRRKKEAASYLCEDEATGDIYQNEAGWDMNDDEAQDDDEDETMTCYQDAKSALLEDLLPNFRDARRALDQARTARGFYPVRNPNAPKGDGKGKGGGKSRDFGDKICVRCGKKGHIARICPQRPASQKGRGRGSENNFVFSAVVVEDDASSTADPYECSVENRSPWEFEEDLDLFYEDSGPASIQVVHSEVSIGDGRILESTSAERVMAVGMREKGRAIIDSGASENIFGEDTLQELADCYDELEFDPAEETEVNSQVHKQFTSGNNQTNAGLGLSHVNAGIYGHQVEVQEHMVEGATPFLLSAKFLYDMDATINFRTGIAVFRNLSDQQFQLERSPSNHLMLPMTAFAGRESVLQALKVGSPDDMVKKLSGVADHAALHVQSEGAKGDPCTKPSAVAE